jgi:hypothetical protein
VGIQLREAAQFLCLFWSTHNKPSKITSRFDPLSEHAAGEEDFTKRKRHQPYCAALPLRCSELSATGGKYGEQAYYEGSPTAVVAGQKAAAICF